MTIIIKPAERSDGAALIQANIESLSYHAPWAQPFTDVEGFEAWFAGLAAGANGAGANVGLVARDAGSIAGVINLTQIFRKGFQNAYLGYYGMAGCARRGLMTQAVRMAADYAFTALGLHRLEANIQPENTASIALAQRAGFRKEGFSPRYLQINGVWRDHERWALLADDPRG